MDINCCHGNNKLMKYVSFCTFFSSSISSRKYYLVFFLPFSFSNAGKIKYFSKIYMVDFGNMTIGILYIGRRKILLQFYVLEKSLC